MKYGRRIWISLFWIVLGAVLLVLAAALQLDSYWNGMGSALVAVGVLQVLRQLRYRSDESYREKVDVQNSDERNRYISTKAWAWAGYLFVLTAAVGSIALKVVGYEEYSIAAAMAVWLLMIFYWLSWLYLRKKY